MRSVQDHRESTLKDARLPWMQVHGQAVLVADREPVMRAQLHEEIVDAPDAEAMLSRILASRLSSRHVDHDRLIALFNDILKGDATLIAATGDDLTAVKQRDPSCRSLLHAVVNFKGFHALLTYRIAQRLWTLDRPDVAVWLSNLASRTFGVDIHPAARLGRAIVLDHGCDIVIGETCVIGNDVSMCQGVTLGGTGKIRGDRHPKVAQGVTIGAGAQAHLPRSGLTRCSCMRREENDVSEMAVTPHTGAIPAKVRSGFARNTLAPSRGSS